MICLDANYLICSGAKGSSQAESLIIWHEEGEILSTSSIAWYEFICGPVLKEQIKIVRSFLTGGIIDFGEAEAVETAHLFNLTGRKRRLRIDAMIAATVIVHRASLATANYKDFEFFVPYGLQLV